MKKYATLFGGAMNNRESKEYLETIEIGQLLAERGYTVKNGGYGGMMEAVSKGAFMAGGNSIGYTCKTFYTTQGNEFLTSTVVCNTLYNRLEQLINGTNVFIFQRGGIGTLSEVFLTLDSIRKLKKSDRPKVFFIGDIWRELIDVLKKDLIPQKDYGLFKIVKDVKQLRGCDI